MMSKFKMNYCYKARKNTGFNRYRTTSLPITLLALPLILSLTLLLTLLVASPAMSASTLVINSGAAEPFITKEGGGFYGQLVKELFSRIDIDAEVIRLPSGRSMLNADQGIDDGVIARIKGMDKKFKNIIRIPVPVIKFRFVAYSMDKSITLKNWESLKPYSVGIIRGWRIFEKNVKGSKAFTSSTNAEELFNRLMNGENDLILYEFYRGTWWNEHLGANAYLLDAPLATKDMFLYVHKKHAALVPKITAALEAMKKDGSYERIKAGTLPAYVR